MEHSGFEAPSYGIIVPEGYTFEKGEDGIFHLVPPKGAEVPTELKPYVKS